MLETKKKISKVIAWKEKSNLSEIYQVTGMLFTIASPKDENGDFIQCHPWVKCRDFLHDALRATINKNSCSIYSFNFDYNKNPKISLDKIRIIVKYSSGNNVKKYSEAMFHTHMLNGLALINHYEKIAGVQNSRLYKKKTDSDETVWLFSGPKFWLSSSFLFSMYTFLIRLGVKNIEFKDDTDLIAKLTELSKDTVDKETGKNDNDLSYLKDTASKLSIFIKKYEEITSEMTDKTIFPEELDINTFHNNGGIVNLCKGNSFSSVLNDKVKTLIK